MAVSNFEKLTVILHKFGIDFNEFNMKFENIEQQDASVVINQQIIFLPQAPSSWSPYNLFLDSVDFVSSSDLGNGVYKYFNPPGIYPQLTGSNPINSIKGSIIFWISSSVDNGTFTLLEPSPYVSTSPQLTVSPNLEGFGLLLNSSRNIYTPSTFGLIPYGQWGLVVITQNNIQHSIYHQNLLLYTGTPANITGSLGFFLYDHAVTNIAFTNRELTADEVTKLYNAEVTADYAEVLGFTPEAYWRGAPLSGTPSYVPNEVF